MSPSAKSILWFVLGPLASLFCGFLVFLLLGFVLGGGVDIDNVNPPWQQALAGLALPAGALVVIGGSLLSYCMAYVQFKQARAQREG